MTEYMSPSPVRADPSYLSWRLARRCRAPVPGGGWQVLLDEGQGLCRSARQSPDRPVGAGGVIPGEVRPKPGQFARCETAACIRAGNQPRQVPEHDGCITVPRREGPAVPG